MKKWLFLLLLLPTAWLSAQEPWCPEPTNRLVNDYSGVLSDEQRQTLEQRLVAFDDSTSNQILVVVTPTLHDCEIMDLGTRIGTTWGVGQKDLKNGLVILIKSRNRDDDDDYGDVALVPGYGLEGALPDVFCKRIIDDEMIGPLSEGDYYSAIVEALEVIEPVCRGEYSYDEYKKEDVGGLFFFLGVLAIIIVVCVILGKNSGNNNGQDHFSDDDSDYDTTRRSGPIFWGGAPRGGFGSGGFGSSGGFGGFGGGSFGGGGAHGRF